ncbi:MAG: mechanosensitive ion channel [Microscillaceae bacterium]|nr:mechanosensitive ion channel [Microscillaceae bacterium]
MMDINKAYSLIFQKIEKWLLSLIEMLPNLVAAILILFIFTFVARLVRKLMQKYLGRISDKVTLNRLFANLVYMMMVLIGGFIALSALQLDRTVTSLLAGAGIVGLALSFAFQDIATNFISGIFLAFRSPFQIGDVVETSGYKGVVEKVDLRISAIRTFQGQMVYLPNKEVFQNPIINYSEMGKRRIDMLIGVAYGEDLQKVEEITKNAICKLDFILQSENVEVFFQEFAESSINFLLIFWVNYNTELEFLKQRSEALKIIKTHYDQYQITIPYPIRTLDFGLKGGEKFSEIAIQLRKG